MLKFLVFFIILIVFVLLLEKILNRLLGVEKKRISETPGKNVDRWGKRYYLNSLFMYYSVLCDGGYQFYKVVLDTICDYIIGFSVYSGVEIPEKLETIYYDTCFSDFNHNFYL